MNGRTLVTSLSSGYLILLRVCKRKIRLPQISTMHGLRGKKLRLEKENFSNDLFNAIKTTMEVLVVFIKAGCQKEPCVKLRLHDKKLKITLKLCTKSLKIE